MGAGGGGRAVKADSTAFPLAAGGLGEVPAAPSLEPGEKLDTESHSHFCFARHQQASQACFSQSEAQNDGLGFGESKRCDHPCVLGHPLQTRTCPLLDSHKSPPAPRQKWDITFLDAGSGPGDPSDSLRVEVVVL